ncbi:MAG: aminotransferase class I/II-fold pyridoxal phosphate-dependent enzyme [Pseudomonadota bacterium]|nr:aminotransferase class I/II-fold pyridoxal phosphate-dependent enzyme [Pseudomonadota bacterium]
MPYNIGTSGAALRPANRLASVTPFRVMRLLTRANELAAAGRDIVHLEVGEPDFGTPEPVVRAGIRGLEAGETRYTNAAGIDALREMISRHYHEDYGVEVDPSRIFVTAGGSGALLLAVTYLLDADDEIIIGDPGYPCNRHFVTALGGRGRLVTVDESSRYQLTHRHVQQAWQENTRGVLMSSPSNPTGSVAASEELRAIGDECRQHHACLIMDEIYQGLCFGADRFKTALAEVPDAIVVNSFSKYFGMTGWRLGWMVVPPAAIEIMNRLAQNLFICASSIAQEAALAAFSDESRSIMNHQRDQFEQRLEYVLPRVRDLGLEVPCEPEGAFYIYARLPYFVPDSETFCDYALESQGVAVTPGTDFGQHEADRHIRIAYTRDFPALSDGVDRLALALDHFGG